MSSHRTVPPIDPDVVEAALAGMDEGIVVQAADGQIIYHSPQAEDILGLTDDQMRGRTSMDPRWKAFDAQGEPLPGERHPAMVALSTAQPVVKFLMGLHKPSGQKVWLSVNSTPLFRTGEDTPYAVSSMFSDITEERMALQSQQDMFQRLSALVDHLDLGILIEDQNRLILQVNQQFCNLFGIPGDPQALLGVDCADSADAQKALFDDPEQWVSEIEETLAERNRRADVLMRMADGRWLSRDFVPMESPIGYLGHAWLYRDVTERLNEQMRLERLALNDSLTGLPNREALIQSLDILVENQEPFALVYLDLDGFKPVNDTYGHDAGDELLVKVAKRLKQNVRHGDTVARLGGDEFVAVLRGLRSRSIAGNVCDRFRLSIGTPFTVQNREVTIGTSLGLAVFPDDASDRESILNAADKAMYENKRARKAVSV